jgi:hypothetical protein
MKLNPEQLRARLLATGEVKSTDIIPCTEEDIRLLQEDAGAKLPAAYLDFLRTCGRGAGGYMDCYTVFFPQVLGLTASVREELGECLDDLPDGAFVFLNDLMMSIAAFRTDEGDDPAVYCWSEQIDKVKRTQDSVWDLFEVELREFERYTGHRTR